jgi:hypothetical protein
MTTRILGRHCIVINGPDWRGKAGTVETNRHAKIKLFCC